MPGRSSTGRATLLVIALAGSWAAGAAAQDINPDRPDLTTSAEVVPAGALQIETGLEYERARVGGGPAERRLGAQGVLRLGLTSALEVSLEGEPFVWLRADEDHHGSGDYTLGLKYRFLAPAEGGAGPALALKPFVKLPAADAPIGSERTDFGALLLMTLGLPWDLSLDANFGVAAIGQSRPEGFVPQGIASGSLSWTATERLIAIAELFFTTKDEREGRDRLITTLALMYRVTPRLAVDAGMRTTLTGRGPDWAAFVGLSLRLGR
jgi:outer membrane putative beta-barrel porin/alpha-amylase